MKNLIICLAFGFLLFPLFLSDCFAQAGKKGPLRKTIDKTVSSNESGKPKPVLEATPDIGMFSVEPSVMVCGSGYRPVRIILRWAAQSGFIPSPITSINLKKTKGSGPELDYTTTSSTQGEYGIDIPQDTPPGDITYTLTVTNEQGRSNAAIAVFQVKSLFEVVQNIELKQLSMADSVSGIAIEGSGFEINVVIDNRNNLDIMGLVKFKLSMCTDDGHCMANSEAPSGVDTSIVKGYKVYRMPFRFITDTVWNKIKVDLLERRTGNYLRNWEFLLESKLKRSYSFVK